MVLSNELVEEIFQTLIKLPYASVAQLVSKLQAAASAHAQLEAEIRERPPTAMPPGMQAKASAAAVLPGSGPPIAG